MRHPPRPRLLLSSTVLSLALSSACSSDNLDEWGKPTLEATGREDPIGKADAMQGVQGLPVSVDSTSTAVWEVTRDWADIEPGAGPAWTADSGLTWDEKYRRWVDSLERKNGSFVLTTPYGRTLPAPSLECAEVAMFLRIAFASWYHLPFIMEAVDGGQRVFFGHFGIRTKDGRWGQMPNFKTQFSDFEHLADEVMSGEVNWPKDEGLRSKHIAGNSGDEQPELFPGASAGAYFDEAFLNKRVGHFLRIQLAFNGSVHLADTANMWNMDPRAIEPGDVLVERWQAEGIGHTIVVKKRRTLGEKTIDGKVWPQLDIEVVSGFMPRRQPRWENSVASRDYATNDLFGGKEFGKFGGGLKRWRAPRKIGGFWTNTVLPQYATLFIPRNSSAESMARLEGRTAEFENIVVVLSPEQRMQLLLENVDNERAHLRAHPASCAARIRREEAFAGLYEVGVEVGMTKDEVDREFRLLEDYVFAELVYTQSKTCCWNSTTSAMFDVAVDLTRRQIAQGSCNATVFMNRDDGQDGYQVFRDFAKTTDRSSQWVSWTEDEACPQAGVRQDTPADTQPTPLCTIIDHVLGNE